MMRRKRERERVLCLFEQMQKAKEKREGVEVEDASLSLFTTLSTPPLSQGPSLSHPAHPPPALTCPFYVEPRFWIFPGLGGWAVGVGMAHGPGSLAFGGAGQLPGDLGSCPARATKTRRPLMHLTFFPSTEPHFPTTMARTPTYDSPALSPVGHGLLWPAILLGLLGWIVELVGLATLQRVCSSTVFGEGADATLTAGFPLALGCGAPMRFLWFIIFLVRAREGRER